MQRVGEPDVGQWGFANLGSKIRQYGEGGVGCRRHVRVQAIEEEVGRNSDGQILQGRLGIERR